MVGSVLTAVALAGALLTGVQPDPVTPDPGEPSAPAGPCRPGSWTLQLSMGSTAALSGQATVGDCTSGDGDTVVTAFRWHPTWMEYSRTHSSFTAGRQTLDEGVGVEESAYSAIRLPEETFPICVYAWDAGATGPGRLLGCREVNVDSRSVTPTATTPAAELAPEGPPVRPRRPVNEGAPGCGTCW